MVTPWNFRILGWIWVLIWSLGLLLQHFLNVLWNLVPFLFRDCWMVFVSISFSTDCRWEITAYFRSLPEASTSKDAGLWIPTDTKQWQQPPLITPIKSMSSEPLCVQLYLEHPTLNDQSLKSERTNNWNFLLFLSLVSQFLDGKCRQFGYVVGR